MQHKSAYIWGLLGKFIPAFVHLCANIILARFLVPEDFGTIGIVTIIFTIANVLIDSGLGGSLVKEKELTKIDCSTIAAFNIGVGLFIFMFVFFTADIWTLYFGIDHLDAIIRVLSLSFLIGPLGLVPKSLLYRDLRFKAISVISISSVLIASLVSIIMAIIGYGVWSLVAFQLVNSSMMVLFCCIVYRYNLSLRFSVESFKRLFSFGFFTTITAVVDTIYENLITTLTGKYMTVVHAGYLSQAKKLEESLTTTLAATIGNVSFPIITKLKDDLHRFRNETFSVFKTIPLLSFPFIMIIAAYSEEIIVFLFGKQWHHAGFYLSTLMFAGLFIILETLVRSFIKAMCEVKKLALVTLIKRLMGIIILIFFVIIEPNAIVLGYVISSIIGYIFNLFLFKDLVNTSFSRLMLLSIEILLPAFVLYGSVVFVVKEICSSFLSQIIFSLGLLLFYFIVVIYIFKLSLFHIKK